MKIALPAMLSFDVDTQDAGDCLPAKLQSAIRFTQKAFFYIRGALFLAAIQR